jgi:hypothetical protein
MIFREFNDAIPTIEYVGYIKLSGRNVEGTAAVCSK